MKNATFLTNGVQLYLEEKGRPTQLDGDGFGAGIINEGQVIVTTTNYNSNRSFSWDLRNTGAVTVLTSRFRGSSSISFYGRIINQGLIKLYMTDIYFENSVWLQRSRGSWEIYGYPYRPPNISDPAGQGKQWQWNEYLVDVYLNLSKDLWNPERPIAVWFREFRSQRKPYFFNKLTAHGRVLVQTYNVQYITIDFAQGLFLGNLSEILLQRYSYSTSRDSTHKSKLTIGGSPEGDFDANMVFIGGDWILEVGKHSTVRTYSRLVIEEGGQFIVQPGPYAVELMMFVGIQRTGILSISGRRKALIKGDIYVRGTLNISSSTLDVAGEFRFTGGALIGQSSRLNINKLGNISGDLVKIIDGVAIYVRRPSSTRSSVVVEYFQYRVDTDLRQSVTDIWSFPGKRQHSLPREFDDPSTEPNTVEFVKGLDRKIKYYGSSPIAVTPNFDSFDFNSACSFTYLYAARMWTFLQIDQQGSYAFFIDSSYGMRVRLWINDEPVFTGNLSRHLISNKERAGPYYLPKGLNRLRVDFIQNGAYWRSENALIITYSGPTFNETTIPQDRMFITKSVNGTLQYANPMFNTTVFMPSNSRLRVGGKGLVLMKNGVSVVVKRTGILQVTDDTSWFSHVSLGSKAKIINSGQVIKTGGDGVASFFVNYTSKSRSSLLSRRGCLKFPRTTENSHIAIWKNTIGGKYKWLDKRNWVPSKIPGPTDDVYVIEEGVYKVIIPGLSNVTVNSLTMGSASSSPELDVNYYGQLSVRDHLIIYARDMTITGLVTSQHLTWAGETIRGSTNFGQLNVQGNFTVIKGM
jgi:hypothetical protein